MTNNQTIIEAAFEERSKITPENVSADIKIAINQTIDGLNDGSLRVASRIKDSQNWETHQWIKKAVLLSFRIKQNEVMDGSYTKFFDKVDSKFNGFSEKDFQDGGYRVVPNANVRKGSFIGKNVVLMPSYVNIGAYVDEGTMVDTWATVGSCAQIGKNVHLSGGVGIGGVLEPIQAGPTIIGDNCFIGARSEVVEGVVVEDNVVISMGVYIGQSTKIYDRETGEVSFGRVPQGSVVVSGNLPSKDGSYSLYCAVIVKKVDEKTLGKVGINELTKRNLEMLHVYGIKNCNTVKKGLEWLNDNKIAFNFFDVKKVDLTTSLINDWIKNISSPYTSENLINKTGMTWRKLSEEEKKLPLTMENIINLIKKYPTAMKRPLITLEGKVLAIGFDENIYEEKIK